MMDQKKIGKFIGDMRKIKGLSQNQLGELIGVTDKTISKWETGSRMPDAAILLELCQILKIDVNELLLGEKLEAENRAEYTKKSEINIVSLVNEINDIHERQEGKKVGSIVGILFIILALLAVLGSSLGISGMINIFDLPTLFYLLGLEVVIIAISGWFRDYKNAWRICFSKNQKSEKEIQLSIQAIKYAGILTAALGCLISTIGIIALLSHMEQFNMLGPSLAQTVLSLFYTAILEIIYVIILFRMKKMA